MKKTKLLSQPVSINFTLGRPEKKRRVQGRVQGRVLQEFRREFRGRFRGEVRGKTKCGRVKMEGGSVISIQELGLERKEAEMRKGENV